jgi:capsular exopolysaccharide synthesis family protein
MTNPTTAPKLEDPFASSNIKDLDAMATYHVLLEKFWLIVTCIGSFLLLGLAYIAIAPRTYEAIATIEVDQSDTPVIATQQVSPNTDLRDMDMLKTIEMEFGRRSLLVRVLKRPEFQGNRYLGALTVTPEDPSLSKQLEDLGKSIAAKLRRTSRLIDITVDFNDPVTAQQLANAMVDEYIIEKISVRSGSSAEVRQFLQQEADKMQVKLSQTELALQDFKILVDLRTRILDTEKEIATLNQRYLPKHPKLISAQNLLKDLETQFQTEMRKRAMASIQNQPGDASEANFSDSERLDREMARQESRSNVLQRDLETDRAMYEGIKQRLKETTVMQSSKLVSVHMVEPAPLLVKPVKPRKLISLAISLALGTITGITLSFWLNSLDSSLKTVDSAEQYLGLPLLGAIPERPSSKAKLLFEAPFSTDGKVEDILRDSIPVAQDYYGRARRWKDKSLEKWHDSSTHSDGTEPPAEKINGDARVVTGVQKRSKPEDHPLIMVEDPSSIVSESFRNMRAAIKLLGAQTERRSFLFTSAVPSEGKSFVSANVAISLAQEGARVLLIDADLRRPMQHRLFKCATVKNGVTEYISGLGSLSTLAIKTEIKNLDLLTAGSTSPNPAELLSTGGFLKLLDDALKQYDRVVIDSAPIHAVSDTLLICEPIHTVCMVVRAGSTPREAVARAIRLLKSYGARLSGFVLNRVPTRSGFGYNPYYYYYQSSEKYGEAYGAAERRS